jgi:hypothetical protein
MDCRKCNGATGHTRKAGCILATLAAEAANRPWTTTGELTEWGYRFADGRILPMGVQYTEWELERNGDPELLTEIEGQPVDWVKRTISPWEEVTTTMSRPSRISFLDEETASKASAEAEAAAFQDEQWRRPWTEHA